MERSTPGLNIKVTTNSYLKMNKLLLIFLGVLAIAAIVSAWDNEEDSSLSEELASSRLVRSADARQRKARKGGKGRKARKGRKGRKGRKAKKGRKGRKNRKNGKKAKKGKNGRKARKGRKGRKGGKKGRKSQSGSRSSGKTATDVCLHTAVTVMKVWKDVVSNFWRQHTRMGKFNTTGHSKNGKGGVFKSAAHKLLTVGGGNKTNLKCSGVNNNTGAAQLKNLTNFLFSCEASVHKVCNLTNFNSLANATKLKACYKTATTFETLAQDCLDDVIDDSTDDACACWQKSSLANATAAAKLCKFNKEAAAYGVALRHCRNAFAKCRKYEDAVPEIISVCSSNTKSLKKSVANLHKNAAKVKKAKTVVKTLTTSTGRRLKRSSDTRSAASCTELKTVVVEMSALILNSPGSPQILVDAQKIINSSGLVCTADEITALAAVDAEFDKAVTHLDSALEAGQSQLLSLTGSTASPEVIEQFLLEEEEEEEAEAATAPAAAATTPGAAATTTTPVATTTVGPTTTVGNVTSAGNTTASNVTATKVTWTMK